MSTPIVLNPKVGFTIAQGTSSFSAELVTAATLVYGAVSGGPYTGTYSVPPATVTADEASGNILVPIGSIAFPEDITYVVATVANAAGASLVSDEVGVQILAVPTAPTLSVA